jgi:hypothetical protein
LGFDPSVEGIVVAVNPSTIEVKTIAGDIFTCMNFPEIMIFPNEALTDVQLDFAHDERENLASQDYRG